jgi:LCP family protein required for cell wall assembly
MTDRTEALIRDAFAAEADHAPDPREVAAALRRARPPRRYGPMLAAAATVVVVAAVVAVVMPQVADRSSGTPAGTSAPTDLNLLLLGVDERGLTDSIVLAHLDADGTAAAVSVPRDSWVDVPGHGMTRLNAVHEQYGIDTLTATIEDLTGAPVNHYAILDQTGLADLSTTVGGVTVCLAAPTSDPTSGANFPAGAQKLSGDAALAFLRQRHGLPNGDLDRIARLQMFMHSMIGELDGAHLPTILDTLKDHVSFDQSLDVAAVADRVVNVRKPVFITAPIANIDFQTPDGGSALELDPAAVRQAVTDAFDGVVPGQAPGSTTAPQCGN